MNTRILGLSVLALAASASAQWTLISPATNPGSRAAAPMAYFPPNGNVIMFGGDNGGFSPPAQTWSYDGTTWSQLAPATSPSAKVGAELVYDALRQVLVMYGSLNTSPFGGSSVDQTWEYNGTTWSQVFPTTTPGGLGAYGACYDSARNRTVLYGGTANSFFPIAESGTWEYNGTDWALITTVGSPGPLERPAMCFHQGLGVSILFGGIDPQVGGVDTTWSYNGTTWTAIAVTGPKPPARSGGKLAYDSVRGVCLLTGGTDPTTGSPIVDTWEFNGTAWTQIANTVAGRWLPMLTFMTNRRQMVLYGGLNPTTFSYFSTTHEYGARLRTFGTGCAGSNGVPAMSALDAPRLGSTYALTLANLNVSVPVAVYAVGFAAITPTPLGSIGMTGCTAYISPDALFTGASAAGASTLSISIPTTLGLLGASLFAQGISLDPGVNPASLTASNATEGTLGR